MPPPKFPTPKPKPHPHPRPGPRRGFWRRGYGPEVVYVEAVSPWLDEWWYFDAWTADLRRLAAEGPDAALEFRRPAPQPGATAALRRLGEAQSGVSLGCVERVVEARAVVGGVGAPPRARLRMLAA